MGKIKQEIIDQIVPLYDKLQSEEKVAKQLGIGHSSVSRYLKNAGYNVAYKFFTSILPYSEAIELFKEWDSSLTKFCKKYHLCLSHFTKYLKQNGIFVENKQNKVKFNENIFDSIDTEEKAYWLGFIYADGYIASIECDKKHYYTFELSLKGSDSGHLEKFNKFMEHQKNNVKIGTVTCNGKICSRCRWGVRNKHLWETLNSYGCVPKKSLILKFPDKNIFKSEDLIRHFLRGYFDGDGCISYANKAHDRLCMSVLGTYEFLNGFMSNTPMYSKPKPDTRKNCYVINFSGKENSMAFKLMDFLYKDSTIYLDRKFDRYNYFCRLYEQSYKESEDKNGEVCDDNTVLTSSIA